MQQVFESINKVFSFVLPVPKNRKNTPNICIEHLYSDEEIKTGKPAFL